MVVGVENFICTISIRKLKTLLQYFAKKPLKRKASAVTEANELPSNNLKRND
jgi:hypothetical protein